MLWEQRTEQSHGLLNSCQYFGGYGAAHFAEGYGYGQAYAAQAYYGDGYIIYHIRL